MRDYEILRKLFHISTCIFPLSLYYYGKEVCLPYFFICLISFLLFDIGRQKSVFLNSFFNYFFSKLTRDYEDERLTGASYICFSILLITLIFETKIAVVSLLIMSFADPCASLFGQSFGRFKLYDKTLEGSIAFFIATSLTLMFFSIPYANIIIVSLACSIVELFSKKIKIDDNLLIPVTGSVILFFLQYI